MKQNVLPQFIFKLKNVLEVRINFKNIMYIQFLISKCIINRI